RDAGLIATNGTQRVDVIPLDERQADILHQPVGQSYLRSVRTSFDDSGQFVEHVVSLLDPTSLALTLDFHDDSERKIVRSKTAHCGACASSLSAPRSVCVT